jgi:hypothetical protein
MNSRQRRNRRRKIDKRILDLFAIISDAHKKAEAEFRKWMDGEEGKRAVSEWKDGQI